MGLDITIGRKIKADYEGLTRLHFFDNVNPEGVYREGWKALEHAVLTRIEADGLKPLLCTLHRKMFEGQSGQEVVILLQIEAVSHG